ncbi:unnamed protein product [Arabidopsis lyrata]|uniref:protein FAR1-RELATED SEQUENCE 5 isoform X2 n=1 Tax=Arabidopsis lyrata subsp. lyrata TaxID=81972 RepID=UPI000A29D7B7|nr:protein FAR1-RELATED SEQUENCE 5 isoform X2 [Arabidopsis lyrata subsp. lyrata]CAH8277009.1 unnamed protein product [Arabidopsis lyrata]|eukprot:XP_020876660.1 protein FAR1-RELATED SEQUENCE 5 isoform X2 [Arabidopsis lyrata subsp. lyrata]
MMTGDLKLHEPYVGMKFESEEEAKEFYVEYSKILGFVVRMMQRRRSGIDGRSLARRLGCNKQGFSRTDPRSSCSSSREGCKATILVKMEKSGKWVVTRFVKEHNHSLLFIGLIRIGRLKSLQRRSSVRTDYAMRIGIDW